jgi:hypothetical protein
MKKLLVAVVLLGLVAFSSSASFAQAGKINFGVGADVVLPIGAFADAYNIGIGGTARGQYVVNDMISLMATAGFISFGGKDVGGFKLESGSMIPILVGGKYYFTPSGSRFYGGADLGISIFKTSVNVPSFNFQTGQVTTTSVSGSSSEFTFQPMIGMEMPMGSGNTKLDIAARFQVVSGGNGLGVRIGLLF